MTMVNGLTQEQIEEHFRETMSWPQYFVSGEGVDAEGFVPAYYKVEGPNGPVTYMNPEHGPFATTMYDFAMEAQAEHFRWCEKEETPFD